MTVTDTLARIDYVLMAESNAAGAEWLLAKFDQMWAKWRNGEGRPPRRHIRPMIDLLDDHYEPCDCDTDDPDWPNWSPSWHCFPANDNTPGPTEGM